MMNFVRKHVFVWYDLHRLVESVVRRFMVNRLVENRPYNGDHTVIRAVKLRTVVEGVVLHVL
jgi:hypothetical protein